MFARIASRVSSIFSGIVPGGSNDDNSRRVPDLNDSPFDEMFSRSGMALRMETDPGHSSGAAPQSSSRRGITNDIPAFPRGEIVAFEPPLGRGSQGCCKKVFVPRLGICAMKTPNDTRDQRSQMEMVFSIMLNHHPNIISFYGLVYHQDPTKPIGFLTEYVRGGSMTSYLENNQNIDFGMKVDWAKQITLAMSYMHSRGIIHRDLNPNNILIDNLIFPTKIKICDFGLARVNDGNSMSLCTGTSCYMAPEVIMNPNRRYDHAVDVFSFAMTLYAIFMEKVPFGDELNNQNLYTYHNRLTGRMLPDYSTRPELDEEGLGDIATLIKRCWSTEPAERGTMDEANAFLTEKYGSLRDF